MDDLILAGAFSVAALYTGVILIFVAGIFVLSAIYNAVASGDAGSAALLLAGILLIAMAYAGTGLWLQGSGRI
jgi:ACR3 family arsenite efflux pump ArsB